MFTLEWHAFNIFKGITVDNIKCPHLIELVVKFLNFKVPTEFFLFFLIVTHHASWPFVTHFTFCVSSSWANSVRWYPRKIRHLQFLCMFVKLGVQTPNQTETNLELQEYLNKTIKRHNKPCMLKGRPQITQFFQKWRKKVHWQAWCAHLLMHYLLYNLFMQFYFLNILKKDVEIIKTYSSAKGEVCTYSWYIAK